MSRQQDAPSPRLLLDLNNSHDSTVTLDRDALAYLQAMPAKGIWPIDLTRHSAHGDQRLTEQERIGALLAGASFASTYTLLAERFAVVNAVPWQVLSPQALQPEQPVVSPTAFLRGRNLRQAATAHSATIA